MEGQRGRKMKKEKKITATRSVNSFSERQTGKRTPTLRSRTDFGGPTKNRTWIKSLGNFRFIH